MIKNTNSKREINVFSSNINFSDERDREYFMSSANVYYDPSEIRSLDEIETLTDIMRKRNREKRIEKIKEWMIPTAAGIIFIVGLLLLIISS